MLPMLKKNCSIKINGSENKFDCVKNSHARFKGEDIHRQTPDYYCIKKRSCCSCWGQAGQIRKSDSRSRSHDTQKLSETGEYLDNLNSGERFCCSKKNICPATRGTGGGSIMSDGCRSDSLKLELLAYLLMLSHENSHSHTCCSKANQWHCNVQCKEKCDIDLLNHHECLNKDLTMKGRGLSKYHVSPKNNRVTKCFDSSPEIPSFSVTDKYSLDEVFDDQNEHNDSLEPNFKTVATQTCEDFFPKTTFHQGLGTLRSSSKLSIGVQVPDEISPKELAITRKQLLRDLSIFDRRSLDHFQLKSNSSEEGIDEVDEVAHIITRTASL